MSRSRWPKVVPGLLAVLCMAEAGPGRAEEVAPHNAGAAAADPAVVALARKAIGTTCTFSAATYGPQIAGFGELKGVGQLTTGDLTVVIRRHGPARVAFLATTGAKTCRIVAAEPLPSRVAGEEFLDCHIDDPDPDKIPPLSQGVGLRQPKTSGLAAYIEVDTKRRTLAPKAGDDKRIRCSGFESGD